MQLKIWHKIFIGISIPALIALIGGLLMIVYIKDTENREGYVIIADDLKELVMEVRRNEKNFLYFKDSGSVDNLQKALIAFDLMLTDISDEISAEIGEGDISLLRQYSLSYPDTMNTLFNNYQDETSIVENVRKEGRDLEAAIQNSSPSEELTTSFILHLRLLEKNYMIFRDNQSYVELNEGISRLSNIIPLCNACMPYVNAIKELFKVYEKSERLVGDMQVIGKNLEKITEGIAIRERERIGVFLAKTKRLIIAALILLSIIGPFFVYKTAAIIVAPINRLADITKKIASGDTTLRAPIREHDETYSLATSFNTMLNKLQLTYESLEKSMELLKEKQAQLVESEKRASLGLLVSGVAHELNNPLNNISLISERMAEEREDLGKEEVKGLNHILWQCERAKHIVDSLLDFARARKSTIMEKQDIVRLVTGSINLVGNQLKINDIDLEKDIPDEPVYINGNRSKLEQILVSIFTNAIQAMKNNGILTISLVTDSEDNTVSIHISDTGPGIREEDMKNIFEPFFTTKPVGEGTGLGLSVCRSLVQEHMGKIEVESHPGEGTMFTITLPLYAGEEVA
jgi:signal transduction histidine kinase